MKSQSGVAVCARLNHWETWYSRCFVQRSHALVPVAVVVIQQGILGMSTSSCNGEAMPIYHNPGVGTCPDLQMVATSARMINSEIVVSEINSYPGCSCSTWWTRGSSIHRQYGSKYLVRKNEEIVGPAGPQDRWIQI